jgi:hypothetical protein
MIISSRGKDYHSKNSDSTATTNGAKNDKKNDKDFLTFGGRGLGKRVKRKNDKKNDKL